MRPGEAPPRARSLHGSVALVTGASRGIGAAVARALAREGAALAINHLPSPEMALAAERVAGEIVASGGRAQAVPADISRPGEVAEMVTTIRASLGPIGILVNNAARMDRAAWTELTVQAWDDMMAVNLRGAFLCARAVHADMRTLGGGKIVNVSSVTAELGRGTYLHYITSKAGILGFTRGLAREVGGDNIQVNCVMPGAIRTEDELERFPDQAALTAELLPLQAVQRRGIPDDVAEAVVFLAGPASGFVTGQVLTVDGGWVFR